MVRLSGSQSFRMSEFGQDVDFDDDEVVRIQSPVVQSLAYGCNEEEEYADASSGVEVGQKEEAQDEEEGEEKPKELKRQDIQEVRNFHIHCK